MLGFLPTSSMTCIQPYLNLPFMIFPDFWGMLGRLISRCDKSLPNLAVFVILQKWGFVCSLSSHTSDTTYVKYWLHDQTVYILASAIYRFWILHLHFQSVVFDFWSNVGTVHKLVVYRSCMLCVCLWHIIPASLELFYNIQSPCWNSKHDHECLCNNC